MSNSIEDRDFEVQDETSEDSLLSGDQSVDDAMNFDPFAEKVEQQKAAEKSEDEGSPPEEVPEEEQKPEETKPSEDAQSSAEEQKEQPSELEQVKEMLKKTQMQLAAFQTQSQEKVQPQQESTKKDDSSVLPDVEVPADFMTHFESEDLGVRRQALQALVNHTKNYIYTGVGRMIDEKLKAVPDMAGGQVALAEQKQSIYRDFYNNPQEEDRSDLLSHPQGKAAVQAAVQHVQQTYGGVAWNPDFRNEIARVARQLLQQSGVTPQMQTPTQPQQPQQQKQKHPGMTGATSKSSGKTGKEALSDEIMATLQ